VDRHLKTRPREPTPPSDYIPLGGVVHSGRLRSHLGCWGPYRRGAGYPAHYAYPVLAPFHPLISDWSLLILGSDPFWFSVELRVPPLRHRSVSRF
jgi:hypothetical protein